VTRWDLERCSSLLLMDYEPSRRGDELDTERDTLVVQGLAAAFPTGGDLEKAIEESTQSHSSFANLKEGCDADSRGCLVGNRMQKASDGPSLALVLIDEVDLLFESDGDIGFWQSLSNLTKNAKCPIILTSTTIPQPLLNTGSISYIHGTLTNPTPSECATKMLEIAKKEGMAHHIENSTRTQHVQWKRLPSCAIVICEKSSIAWNCLAMGVSFVIQSYTLVQRTAKICTLAQQMSTVLHRFLRLFQRWYHPRNTP